MSATESEDRLSLDICQQCIQMQLNVLFVDTLTIKRSRGFLRRLLSILR